MVRRKSARTWIRVIGTAALLAGLLGADGVESQASHERGPSQWSFETGLDAWKDGGGAPELGFYAVGRPYSTQEMDPRRGWRHADDGREGTAGVRGRRINGTFMYGSLESPSVVVPIGRREVTATLWYRWDERALDTDEIVVLVSGTRTETRVSLVRDPALLGTWQSVTLTGQIPDRSAWGRPQVSVGLLSKFAEPLADCSSNALWQSHACNLGFTLDDVSLTWG